MPIEITCLQCKESSERVFTVPAHCKHGHAMTPENTYLTQQRGRQRWHCRACMNRRMREYHQRKKAQVAHA